MVLRLPKKKSKSPPRIGKKLQDYIDRNPLRRTEFSKILKEARSRKPTGVINIDDFYNSQASMPKKIDKRKRNRTGGR